MGFAAALSIFLSAFLLFLVQPMLGKMILPWFGGTPAVWTTCLLFFQVLLLGGYAYAAALARWLGTKRQASVHVALLVLTLALLPVTPSAWWKPPDGQMPVLRILWMLLVCVGAPYFLLSANSPLVQGWFARAYPGRSPYRLYALSNTGSLGALLSYPFLVEPALRSSQQGWIWSLAFGVYVLVSAAIAWTLWKQKDEPDTQANTSSNTPTSSPTSERVPWKDRALWLLLPGLSSLMLMAVTNHLCQDVAVVPFLWILPLSIYLVTLIICFDRDQWYKPLLFSVGSIITLLAAADLSFVYYLSTQTTEPLSRWMFLLRYDIRIMTIVYLTLFFFACMLCHGEVVRRRPKANRLTEYYLTISAGGALGGLFVAIICPAVFRTYMEIRIGLVVCMGLALAVTCRELSRPRLNGHTSASPPASSKKKMATKPKAGRSVTAGGISPWLLGIVAVLLMIVMFGSQYLSHDTSKYGLYYRNFYGALTVRYWYPEDDPRRGRAMYHGSILHGYQLLWPEKRRTPTTYYTEDSGVGKLLLAKRDQASRKVGIVGLGTGTLACYAQASDTYRIYEINPLVIELAQTEFSFLSDCQGKLEIVPGDARLSLEREPDQQFDVLVLDAFSGDSIPVHLLTREAMQVYLRHLKPDGVIAIHISNRYVDLLPVVASLGEEYQLHAAHVSQPNSVDLHISTSAWVLLTASSTFLDHSSLVDSRFDVKVRPKFDAWTDDFNNLFEIMRAP